MVLSVADQIWNRAALEEGGEAPCAGDIALSSLLLLHGMVMNGGICHAVEALTTKEFDAGVLGFQYYKFKELTELLSKAKESDDNEFDRLDIEYGKLIYSDSVIAKAFEKVFKASPEEFSPI